jgi:Holliday junction resolvase RusA-like endonuclease
VSGRALSFTVLGRPQPAGSKSAFAIRKGGRPTGRIAVRDSNPNAKPWQAHVAAEAADAIDGRPLQGPLELTLIVWLARPQGHYGSGRNFNRVRPSAPVWPAVRPDLTKYIRAIEDALNGLLWRDDAQVVVQQARKEYGWPERAEIEVRELEAEAA